MLEAAGHQDWNHLSSRDGEEVSAVQEEDGEDSISTPKSHL